MRAPLQINFGDGGANPISFLATIWAGRSTFKQMPVDPSSNLEALV